MISLIIFSFTTFGLISFSVWNQKSGLSLDIVITKEYLIEILNSNYRWDIIDRFTENNSEYFNKISSIYSDCWQQKCAMLPTVPLSKIAFFFILPFFRFMKKQ